MPLRKQGGNWSNNIKNEGDIVKVELDFATYCQTAPKPLSFLEEYEVFL